MKGGPIRLVLGVLAALVAADGVWLLHLWPDWRAVAGGTVPPSRFMRDWEKEEGKKAAWHPVPLSEIPPAALKVFLVSEDAGFWEHGAFDLPALEEAAKKDARRHRIVLGGSTIDQQTAKNLFLTASKSPLRKWHEAVLTWGLERHVPKRRILEIYLNDAEMGPGLYGLEAASVRYFGIHARELSQGLAIELAASLPYPKTDNPDTRSDAFVHRVDRIRGLLSGIGELEVELPPEEVDSSSLPVRSGVD